MIRFMPRLPHPFREVFRARPSSGEESTALAYCYGPQKIIAYFKGWWLAALPFIRAHERGHAWQFLLNGHVWHCSNLCIMSRRKPGFGVLGQILRTAWASIRRGSIFCDTCRKMMG